MYTQTKSCNHLFGFLRSYDYFHEIDLEEISSFIYMLNDDDTIESSNVFLEDDKIIVTSGPLLEYSGYIKKIDKRKNRAKILFKFSGQDHLIDVSINIIRKLEEIDMKNEIMFFKSR